MTFEKGSVYVNFGKLDAKGFTIINRENTPMIFVNEALADNEVSAYLKKQGLKATIIKEILRRRKNEKRN